MAKKLPWGKFTHEDLRVDHEDDIYLDFPFLKFVGNSMINKIEFRTGDNSVRSFKETKDVKMVGLSASLYNGWDRTSWPIPYVKIKTKDHADKEAFDRRHTLNVCRKYNFVDEVPGAQYERIFPTNKGHFNKFDLNSILTMAAMWGNVFGPIVEDTKEHNFETACIRILKTEDAKVDRSECNLIQKDFIRFILKYMGCYHRYDNNMQIVNRIAGRVMEAFRDPETVADKLAINNNQKDLNTFIENSEDWQPNNTEDEKYHYETIIIQDNDSLCFTYGEKLLTRLCSRNDGKITKVLLYNEKNAENPKKIVSSRNRFKQRLNSSYQIRRNDALASVESILNKEVIPTKKLNEFPLELWYMNQIEDEEEPFEVAFDSEEG
jgi:hypothetical protein